jgi:glycosyltransferase involved in cell wall biosynthesis
MITSAAIIISVVLITELAAWIFLIAKNNAPPIKTKKEYSVTLIIPFKNESDNLQKWIQWIKSQKELPSSILFINDNSEDGGENYVKTFANQYRSRNNHSTVIKCYDLPQGQNGKKAAIAYGIESTESTYILTMDADVEPADSFFESLSELNFAPLNLFPVEMRWTNNSFAAIIGGMEHKILQSQNFLFASLTIMTASGANMLFSRKHYKEFCNGEMLEPIPSGDDHYFLRAFQSKSVPIAVSGNQNLKVTTNSPVDCIGYFNQRTRWLGKLFRKADWRDWTIGSVLCLVIYSSAIFLIGAVLSGSVAFFLGCLFLVTLMYYIPILVFTNSVSIKDILGALLMAVCYPIVFSTVFIVAMIRPIPNWK